MLQWAFTENANAENSDEQQLEASVLPIKQKNQGSGAVLQMLTASCTQRLGISKVARYTSEADSSRAVNAGD